MELTAEQLTRLREYSSALLTPQEIAILLEILPEDRKSFCICCRLHEGNPIYEAFHQGRLITKLELRTNIIRLAKAGSPAAEPLAEKFLSEQNLDK